MTRERCPKETQGCAGISLHRYETETHSLPFSPGELLWTRAGSLKPSHDTQSTARRGVLTEPKARERATAHSDVLALMEDRGPCTPARQVHSLPGEIPLRGRPCLGARPDHWLSDAAEPSVCNETVFTPTRYRTLRFILCTIYSLSQTRAGRLSAVLCSVQCEPAAQQLAFYKLQRMQLLGGVQQ